jgi:hypothetical protein
MRTDPLRAAGWGVVILAALVFIAEVRRLPEIPPVPAPVPTTTTVRSPVPDPDPPAPTYYVGNTNTHRFHLASCRYAGCKNCTARFTTRDEAVQAGFRPGGCCDP